MSVTKELIALARHDRGAARYQYARLSRVMDVGARLGELRESSSGDARADAAACLFAVAPDRAVERGWHRELASATAMLQIATRDGVVQTSEKRLAADLASDDARFLARLLEVEDDAILRATFASGLVDKLARLPDGASLLPFDLLRGHLASSDREIRNGACAALSYVHLPEDAERVLASLDAESPHYPIAWLAPLPASRRLVPWLAMDQLAELLERRRLAGISNVGLVDSVALARGEHGVPSTLPGRLVRELRDERLLRAWLPRRPLDTPTLADDIHETILWFGEPALQLLAKRIEWEREAGTDTTMSERVYSYLCTHRMQPGREPPYEHDFPAQQLGAADLAFACGHLGDSSSGSAWAHYARILAFAPRCAHAALQIAWLDRAYGTPISDARIAWLRSLGVVGEALLAELATPIAPWPTRSRSRDVPAEHAPPRVVLELHVDRVRAATSSPATSSIRRPI